MRRGTEQLLIATPDVSGILALAALRRRFGPQDYQFLRVNEVARRLSALAGEPSPSAPWVVDLVPTDSVETLLVPALHGLTRRGARATWVYGRAERPPKALNEIANCADLMVEPGTPSWKLVCRRGDEDYCALSAEIQDASTERGSAWSEVLRALSSSWDWTRMYRAVNSLASLRTPDEETLTWARALLNDVERARAAAAEAPVRSPDGLRLAVVVDPLVGPRVRCDTIRDARDDVDGIVVTAGPGRLTVVATTPEAVSHLFEEFSELASQVAPGPLVNLAWNPKDPPKGILKLLGQELHATMLESPPPRGFALIDHPDSQRVAKGMDADAIPENDRAAIEEALDKPS